MRDKSSLTSSLTFHVFTFQVAFRRRSSLTAYPLRYNAACARPSLPPA